MATNDFKAFAIDPLANVLSQAEYVALTTLIQEGFVSGIAESKQLNKVWRQSSVIAEVIGQYIVDGSGADALDDGNVATLLANFKLAVAGSAGLPHADATGTGDALVVNFTPDVAFAEGATIIIRPPAANTTTTPTVNVDAGGAKTIVKGNNLPLVAGDIAGAGHWLILTADVTLNKWVLANPAKGVNVAGATGGGNDQIFWQNGQTVTEDFTVAAGINAGSFGPTITIASGKTVTVNGNWTIV